MPAACRRRVGLGPAAVFSLTLAAAAVGTALVVDRVPALKALRPGHEVGRPPDRDYYLANDIGGHVDHHVLYFGLDEEVLTRMRAADVLFLGNSRLMFGLRPEVLRPAFEALGLTYYVMGFGFREADRFPLAIVRKFDLRPRVVVVNADGFFGGGISPWAEQVMRDTPFAARKWQWEAEIAHEVRRVVQVVFPHWPSFLGRPGLGLAKGFTAYRSRRDGTWALTPWPAGVPFEPAPLRGPGVGRGEAAAAREVQAEFAARGSRLLLTRVPTPVGMPGAGPEEMAELLQAPLLAADVTAPSSADHSHLDEASAHDWSLSIMAALTPHLRALGPVQ